MCRARPLRPCRGLPAGWQRTVEALAANKIMAQARNKLQQRWQSEMRRAGRNVGGATLSNRALADYFLKVDQ
jgi:hypothetical protein